MKNPFPRIDLEDALLGTFIGIVIVVVAVIFGYYNGG